MAVLPIRIYGDPVLREKARPVESVTAEIRELASDMIDTLLDAEGVGLAGPQVGVSHRLILVHPPSEEEAERLPPRVLVNPRLVEKGGEAVSAEEGCLSIPGIFETVTRAESVRVEATDLDGNALTLDASGWPARILQHEIDHLDGVLFIDRVGPMRRALLKKRLRELAE